MDTSKTLKGLIKQLYTPLLFFIPKSIIPLSELSEFRNIKTEDFFNTIVLLSENNATEKVLAIKDCTPLLEKASILNYNTIALMDIKENASSLQFSTLLESYIMHLRFYSFISKWMNENVINHCDANKKIKGYFQLQADCFQYHKLQIENKFSIRIISNLNSVEILSYINHDDYVPLKDVIENQKSIAAKATNPIPEKSATVKLQKPILITDDEARSFLLATVFNSN
ncbi:hypothetical protein [Maribacter hydrothermalis]|uniref:Uncharacterized protein n=1 Tax=Maribacter hydrothermalis TaxID=1836467 RepID=A0A1B7Z902_9FLAO|nr:hypothetical protein [Maribacter hydrothermalis]APQ18813.1 hypothetical protein BTR34_16475 [Maribacter hydrothermalis]OBR39173.1 hypothetical protein A9200_05800 [Maribacter hydrothermalis]